MNEPINPYQTYEAGIAQATPLAHWQSPKMLGTLSQLGFAGVVLFYLAWLVMVLSVPVSFFDYPDFTEISPLMFFSVGIFAVIITISLTLVFLLWLYRMCKNLPALGVEGLTTSPGWAVGWFFVPIMNLVKPHQVVSEVAKAGLPVVLRESTDWHLHPVSPLVHGWWLLFVVGSAYGGYMGAVTREEQIFLSLTTELVSVAIGLAMNLCGLFMVRKLTRDQIAKYKLLSD